MNLLARDIDTRAVIAAQVLGALGFFFVDLTTPPGIADGVGYPIVLVLCLWVPSRRYLAGWVVATVVLTLIGAVFGVGGGVGHGALVNRLIAIGSIGIVAVLIHGRQRDVERFKSLAQEASAASQAKSEFLANMSHELRTPLNAIIGFSEIVTGEMFGPIGQRRYIEYAEYIRSSGVHLLSIISDILDLSKIESGRRELSDNVVDLCEAAEAALRLLRGRAEDGRIRLVNGIGRGTLPHILADARAVKQILLNLLSNAVKFTPEGGRVAISAETRSDGSVAVSIDDTGIGIAPENMARALAPFSQVDGSSSRSREGTGLGLPLVKSLIELHGGTLEIESEVGKGTLATVVFPPERVTSRSATPPVGEQPAAVSRS